MVAQAQECIFKGLLLSASAMPDNSPAQLQLAQEAAQVKPRSPAQGLQQAGQAHPKSEEQSSVGLGQSWVGVRSGKDGQPHT